MWCWLDNPTIYIYTYRLDVPVEIYELLAAVGLMVVHRIYKSEEHC